MVSQDSSKQEVAPVSPRFFLHKNRIVCTFIHDLPCFLVQSPVSAARMLRAALLPGFWLRRMVRVCTY
jgi:hypothetical protein